MKKAWSQKNRRLIKRHFPAPLFFLVVLLIIFGLGRANLNLLQKHSLAEGVKEETQLQLDDLESQKAQLQNNIEQLSTGEGIEEEIREKFRVVKDGEQLVIIVDNEERGAVAEQASENSEDDAENHQELKDFFSQ